MAFKPRSRMDPAAPELAVDAYDLHHGAILGDRPNIRLCGGKQRSQRELASDFVVV